MADHPLALQGAFIAELLADAGIVGVVGARSYNEEPPPDPAWPFTRTEIGDDLPDEASCWTGGNITITVHCFVMGPSARPCRLLVDRIARLLDGRTDLVLEIDPEETGPAPRLLELGKTRSIVVRDADEPKGYHGLVEFNALTAEDA